MGNRVKIRRGAGTPTTSNLETYELGYDTTNKKLYINDNGTIKEITSSVSYVSANEELVLNIPQIS